MPPGVAARLSAEEKLDRPMRVLGIPGGEFPNEETQTAEAFEEPRVPDWEEAIPGSRSGEGGAPSGEEQHPQ